MSEIDNGSIFAAFLLTFGGGSLAWALYALVTP